MKDNAVLTPQMQKNVIAFAQELIRIQSYPGEEKDAIEFVEEKMKAVGYDEVIIDSMGNVIGRIGNGDKAILFDAHVDTVRVNDAEAWEVPPFSGEIRNGRLHGRGAVDMKSSVAASIYAGAFMKEKGLPDNRTVYVSCTVMEEDCDGENLKHLLPQLTQKPDYVVICEPSNNTIALGHKGKAQFAIKTIGKSAHGATPEKGLNAIYEMAEIISRAEDLNNNLKPIDGRKGSLVLSQITSVSASLNAVPSECEIYLDRRTVPGESEDDVKREIEQLIRGKKASWRIGTLHRKSWTGLDVVYEPFHPAWKIDLEHELTQTSIKAYSKTFGSVPDAFEFWDFSTNAVTPVSLGIPTIGFGPGDSRMAHMRDESCPTQQILDACSFYMRLIESI